VAIKRLNYFTHQFLREDDFKAEQAYHRDMRRRHNRVFHTWGVAEGLEVQKKEERAITINPGTAVDKEGRELVLLNPVARDLSTFNRNSETYITIGYAESWDEGDHYTTGGVEGYSRITESPEILERRHQPHHDGTVVTLARIRLNDLGHVHHIDMGSSIRKSATTNPAAGWLRLPFKPIRLYPVGIEGKKVRILNEQQAEEYEFIVDEATAYCDKHGARGSMEIPVPPAAARIVGFRIGGTTSGKVTVHMYRTGWNIRDNRGEKHALVSRSVGGPTFYEEIPIPDGQLDDCHALAVAVIAEGESAIWLVAARFE
jgi:hypothetical protein